MDLLTFWATMVLLILAPVLAAAIITVAMVRLRILQSASILHNGIRLSIAIVAVRVPLVWISAVGLYLYPDWRQVAGHFLLGLNCFSEMLLARSWRNEVWGWSSILSVAVALSSVILGMLFALLVQLTRRRRKPG